MRFAQPAILVVRAEDNGWCVFQFLEQSDAVRGYSRVNEHDSMLMLLLMMLIFRFWHNFGDRGQV